jgi:catechol 2,3-dioxygenase-like lactoylglutathione lyase family enzyme
MKIEHFAVQVADPVAMAAWYVQHLGMTVQRAQDAEPFAHFIADDSGKVMIEIYRNPKVAVPDHAAADPLLLHLAFVSDNPDADAKRIEAAGASLVERIDKGDGDLVIMMRDPWGLAIQFCRRAEPMV